MWVDRTCDWKVDGVLEAKVRSWRDKDRHERDQEDIQRRAQRWTNDTMDVDEDGAEVNKSSEEEDDEEDSEEVKALKVRNSLVGAGSNACRHDGDICDHCLCLLNDYPLPLRHSGQNGIYSHVERRSRLQCPCA